ncbi:hypothetical protein NKH21_26925 [Mesorhizobium sp. M1329]
MNRLQHLALALHIRSCDRKGIIDDNAMNAGYVYSKHVAAGQRIDDHVAARDREIPIAFGVVDQRPEAGKCDPWRITHDPDEVLRLGDRIAILRDGEIIQQGTGQNIMLRPADDYIARFVREVNRSKVVKAASIMNELRGRPPVGPELEDDASLENAVKNCDSDRQPHCTPSR